MKKQKAIGIIVGAHQWEKTWLEGGLSYARYRSEGILFGGFYRGISLSALYNPFDEQLGMGFSRWRSWFSFGFTNLRVNAYTNFSSIRVAIQPQLGIRGGHWSLSYGYAWIPVAIPYAKVNTNEISFRYNLPIYVFKRDKWWKRND